MSELNQNPEPDDTEGTEDPQVMELVAYLDGELPSSDADRVEQLLLENASLRKNAETLDRTWQLLDSLEEAAVSGEFTRRTLASISTVSAESGSSSRPVLQRWNLKSLSKTVLVRGLTWSLAGFLACSVGLVLSRNARREMTSPDDAEILNHLDLYQEYPKLWRIPDAEFLREVSQGFEPATSREDGK